jgi:hypothetical protein
MLDPEARPRDLEGFVLDKLIHVIGSPSAAATLGEAKKAVGVDRIQSVADVISIGKVMAGQGGFIGIVGDLLILEAGRWGTP